MVVKMFKFQGKRLGVRSVWLSTALCVLADLLPSASARGAAMSYSSAPITDPDITYRYSVSTTYKPVPLDGGPVFSPSPDALHFAALKFAAISSNGTAKDFADCKFNVTLTAAAGKAIRNIAWSEGGNWDVHNVAPAAGNNVATVQQGNFAITVTAVDGVALATPLYNNSVPLTFATGKTFQTSAPGADTGSWAGSAAIDLDALFGTTGITQVTVSYLNDLTAQSTAGGTASIGKSYLNISPTVAAVPEPASLGILFAGGLLALRRRRA